MASLLYLANVSLVFSFSRVFFLGLLLGGILWTSSAPTCGEARSDNTKGEAFSADKSNATPNRGYGTTVTVRRHIHCFLEEGFLQKNDLCVRWCFNKFGKTRVCKKLLPEKKVTQTGRTKSRVVVKCGSKKIQQTTWIQYGARFSKADTLLTHEGENGRIHGRGHSGQGKRRSRSPRDESAPPPLRLLPGWAPGAVGRS